MSRASPKPPEKSPAKPRTKPRIEPPDSPAQTLPESGYWELLPLLRKLDDCLLAALKQMPIEGADGGTGKALQTLQPQPEELIALLQKPAGTARYVDHTAPSLVGKAAGRWAQLQTAYGLEGFELDLLLLALAPELDLRYQRIYGALQDDATRSYPGIDLALNLLCNSPHDRLRRRRHFAPEAPLSRHRLLQTSGDGEPLLARSLRVAPDLIELLLNTDKPDATTLALKHRAATAMSTVTRRLPLLQSWDDLVLPSDAAAQLRELCGQVEQRQKVLGDWGFGAKLVFGRGVAALFSGPSGTGKTMAAGVVARQLGRELFRVDLSQVVSKYIGETEKNLGRVFDAAADISAVLFFDEADALFGKRSEVKDAHDRHANVEVGYLLQKMEEYEGLAILATNLRRNLDPAFFRRLNVVIEFPFPDEAQRLDLWRRMFPPQAPLASDVNFALLARELRLSGGHLRNIALAAASLAAAAGTPVGRDQILLAARREHEKLGHSWSGGA